MLPDTCKDVHREPGSELESKPVASRSRNLDILLDFFESYFLHL